MSHPDFERLVAYWLGEDDDVEEHYFACAQCTERLEWLAALSQGVRAALRAGALGLVVSSAFVEAMKRAGMRLREYPAAPGATVQCTLGADEDGVVSRLRAPLGGVKRIDVVQHLEVGGVAEPETRLEDVPFDAAAGEVLVFQRSALLKRMPQHRARVRLVSVGADGESPLGEYTFSHTPS
jgi:hypothetical protein